MKYKQTEMNRVTLITTLLLFAALVYTSCNNGEKERVILPWVYIEGLTIDNYPIIDGSTSTLPLNTVIACELMGFNYRWQEAIESNTSTWSIEPQIGEGLRERFDKVIKSSQTHNSYINLIDKKADIVLTARTMSSDERRYAEEKGVNLIETPIAIDAFIFIVNPLNPISGLTTGEIQDIYTGRITNWKELPTFPDNSLWSTEISPYIRNQNSGSQELMDLLVMKDLEYYVQLPIYEEKLIPSMPGLIDAITNTPFAIGYTVYYYNEQIIRPGNMLKTIGVDGVFPNEQTIDNRSYPYVAEVYAVIRSDTDESSMAYKIYEWMQTEAGRQVISKCGYIPN